MRMIGDFLFLILFFMLIGVWLVMWIGFPFGWRRDSLALDYCGRLSAAALVPPPNCVAVYCSPKRTAAPGPCHPSPAMPGKIP